MSRELNEIARALDINIGDEETKESSSKPIQANQGVSQEKETYASALMRQGTSIVNGGLGIVKSLVNGTDEKPLGMAAQKKIEDAGQEESSGHPDTIRDNREAIPNDEVDDDVGDWDDALSLVLSQLKWEGHQGSDSATLSVED